MIGGLHVQDDSMAEVLEYPVINLDALPEESSTI